ncbi:MAG: HPP family protein [Planctomycetota bacterium]|jgi:CBS-domain-containing membrane protein
MSEPINNSSQTTITAKFKRLWIYYIFQSLLAAAALAVLVLILGKEKMVIISAMGATAFIVFAMPKAVSARTRNVIGGHLVGLAAGAIFSFMSWPYLLEYPLTVALVIFLMVALDVEHPPAAGTALAVVINEVSRDAFITIMVSTVVLSQCRYYLRSYLKDLV